MVVREKIQNRWKGDRMVGRRGWGGSAALAEGGGGGGGQIEQWRYTSWRSPRRKSQCYLQKKQGRSSRSESYQEF